MIDKEHYQRLIQMYAAAPLNDFYTPKMEIDAGSCHIKIPIKPELFHAAMAVHGSVYFKMLDDAAFFAANSLEKEFFVLTTSFTTYLTRPISSGEMTSIGKVVNQNRTQFIAESVVYDGRGKEIGRGNGIFVRSKTSLMSVAGYQDPIK